MADISQELQAIMQAVYGEEVRGSIHDAIDLINKVGEVVLSTGTAVTSPTSSVTGFYDGSLYLNTDTSILWKCNGTGWVSQGSLAGSSIQSIVKTDTSGLVDTYTITLTNGNTHEFYVTNGYSPTITVSKSGSVTTVTITDINGTQTVQILDGDGVIEQYIAPIEESPSTHAYTEGKQLFYNDVLYTVIDDIDIGDSLIVGTNISASDDLVTQIANAGKGVNTDKTMQEYQALTPEQQADPDTYYWIDDDPGIDYDNIRDIVAPTEYSTAVGGHSTGDEFILGDYLYKALSTIQQGDPIVTSGGSANATLAGTIVSQIKALFDGETVLKNMKTMITDCNTGNTTQGIRWYLVDTQSANAPTTSYGILLEIVRYSAQVNQFYMVFSGSDYSIYFRSKGSGSWPTTGGYGWKQIYGASLLSGTQQATTIASAVNTVIATIANVPAGTYLVTGRITYEANTNGIRDIGITDSSTSGTMEGTETATVSGATTMSATRYITLSSTGTIYLKGYQTSGSTLNISNYELKAHIM